MELIGLELERNGTDGSRIEWSQTESFRKGTELASLELDPNGDEIHGGESEWKRHV